MLKFKFHFPVTVEKVENSVDPEKTFVEVSAGKKVSINQLIEAFNSKAATKENIEEVEENSTMEIQNSKGETVKVTVKQLVEAYNASDESKDKDKDDDKDKDELENSMDDKQKDEYGNMDDEAKCSYRKNMRKERKNAKDLADKETNRLNAIKVKEQEDARLAANNSDNIKNFQIINSKGAHLAPETVVGSKDDGSMTHGVKRGKNYFGKKFTAKK